MPVQEICTGLIASRPASIRSSRSGRTPPQQWSITFTSASSLARLHIRACRGLKNSRYMAGEICGPFCMPRSSPKRMTSMYGPTAPRNRSRLARCMLDEAVEELVGPPGVAGQEHEEVVDAVEELAHLQQVAAEQADDGAVGPLAERLGTLGQALGRRRVLRPAVPAGWRSRTRCFVHGLGDSVQVVLFQERPMGLLEVTRKLSLFLVIQS